MYSRWIQKVASIVVCAIAFTLLPLGGAKAAPPKEVPSARAGEEMRDQASAAASANVRQLPDAAEGKKAPKPESRSEQRVIVTFTNKADMNLLRKKNGNIKREHKKLASVPVTLSAADIEALKKDPAVQAVEPDIQIQAAAQTIGWGTEAMAAPAAWSAGYTGQGIQVAVIDSGIAAGHEDVQAAGGVSFVDYTASYDDDSGHGTHVAGIIAAKNNEIGMVGVAPNAGLYAVKVLDSSGKGYLSDVIAGIDWAIANDMDIINLSIATPVDSLALHQAVDRAYEQGVLVVASAGNTGLAASGSSTVQYPAKYSSVIAVGAVDDRLQRAAFSAAGPELELTAPGVAIASTHLHNGYQTLSGTSMAAPFVTGELALLKEEFPAMGAQELRQLLRSRAVDAGEAGKDSLYGYGIAQAGKREPESVPEPEPEELPPPEPGVVEDVYGMEPVLYAAGADRIVSYESFLPNIYNGFGLYGLAASTLADGRVFLSGGGYQSSGNMVHPRASYLYQPASNTLTRVANTPIDLSFHRQTTLLNGKVFISRPGLTYMYDPGTNSYTTAASMPQSCFSGGHSQSLLSDGRVFVTGGYNTCTRKIVTDSYIYNPATNAWTAAAPTPIGLSSQSQSTLKDGRVLVTGYDYYKAVTLLYDPALNAWTQMAPTPLAKASHEQLTLLDGRVAVLGGGLKDSSKSIYLYDVKTNTWTTSSLQLPYVTSYMGASLLQDGRIALFGGNELTAPSTGAYSPSRALRLISFNNQATLTVASTNQTVYPQTGSAVITLSGTVSDPDNDSVTVSAAMAGVVKSAVVTNTAAGPAWQLQWNAAADAIPQGSYSGITITANDGQSSSTAVYAGTIQVDNNRAPGAPAALNPFSANAASSVLVASSGSVLAWSFQDADPGDSQSAYHLVVTAAGSGATVWDTGWVASSLSSYTLPAGKLTAGQAYAWKVCVKDSKGAVSTYSALSYIRANVLPSVVLTSYSDGQQMNDNVVTLTWTYSDANGQAQTSYQVLGSKDNWATVAYTSGMVNTSVGSHTTTPLTDGAWSFAVLVKDGLEWSARAYRSGLKLPNALEPNDTSAQAFPVGGYGLPISSLLGTASDVDYFRYTAGATGIDELTLTVPVGTNYDVHVYDAGMNLISSGIRGPGVTESLLYRVNGGSAYFIKIVGVNGDFSTTSVYTCTVHQVSLKAQTDYQYDANGNIKAKTTNGQP